MAVGTVLDIPYALASKTSSETAPFERGDVVRPMIRDLGGEVKIVEPPASDIQPLRSFEGRSFEGRSLAPNRLMKQSEPFAELKQLESSTAPKDAVIPGEYLSLLPYACIGKVDIVFDNGQHGLGSGFVIGPNTIVTVGHNVIEHHLNAQGAIIHSDRADAIYFSPAYDGYSHGAPYGRWSAAWAYAATDWVLGADSRYDIAIIRLNPLNGQSIGDVLGWWLEIYTHHLYYENWSMFGYPYLPSDNDNPQLRQVNTIGVGGDGFWNEDLPIAAPSTVFKGMSGGPWFRNFNPYDVQTFGVFGMSAYTRGRGNLYSIYFGDVVRALQEEYFSISGSAAV